MAALVQQNLRIHRAPPDVGLAASAAWKAFPFDPPYALGSPHASLGSPLPEHREKSQGLEVRGRVGREGLWLEGRVLQPQRGGWWGPSKGQLGSSPHLGALELRRKMGLVDLVVRDFCRDGSGPELSPSPPTGWQTGAGEGNRQNRCFVQGPKAERKPHPSGEAVETCRANPLPIRGSGCRMLEPLEQFHPRTVTESK